MAQIKVTALTAATVLAGNDVLLLSKDIGGGFFQSQKISHTNLKITLGLNGTLNIIPKYGITGFLNSLIYDNGTEVGLATVLPTARLQIKGIGSNGTTKSLLIENSTLTNMLTVLDDGKIGINNIAPSTLFDLKGLDSTSAVTFIVKNAGNVPAIKALNNNNVLLANDAFEVQNNGAITLIGASSGVNSPAFNIVGSGGTLTLFDYNTGGIQFRRAGIPKAFIDSTGNAAFGDSLLTALARVHIKGNGATSATNAFLVHNSSSVETFRVQDNGFVGVRGAPTSAFEVFTSVSTSKLRIGDNLIFMHGAATNIGINFSRPDGNYTIAHGIFEQAYRLKMLANDGFTFTDSPTNADPHIDWKMTNFPTYYFSNGLQAKTMGSSMFRIHQSSNNLISAETGLYVSNATASRTNGFGAKIEVTGATTTTNTALQLTSSGSVVNYALHTVSGGIHVPSLQVGNAGLVSGNLYVDTAANILANGDLIVARKV